MTRREALLLAFSSDYCKPLCTTPQLSERLETKGAWMAIQQLSLEVGTVGIMCGAFNSTHRRGLFAQFRRRLHVDKTSCR